LLTDKRISFTSVFQVKFTPTKPHFIPYDLFTGSNGHISTRHVEATKATGEQSGMPGG